ncbi:MAG: hypothetical protein ACI9ES_001905 [Oceanospirillaceae bacterium]|jgi:hypothetical protein
MTIFQILKHYNIVVTKAVHTVDFSDDTHSTLQMLSLLINLR